MPTWREYIEGDEYGDMATYPALTSAKTVYQRIVQGREKAFMKALRGVIQADQGTVNGAKVVALVDLHDLVDEFGPKAIVRLYAHVPALQTAMKAAGLALWAEVKAANTAANDAIDGELAGV